MPWVWESLPVLPHPLHPSVCDMETGSCSSLVALPARCDSCSMSQKACVSQCRRNHSPLWLNTLLFKKLYVAYYCHIQQRVAYINYEYYPFWAVKNLYDCHSYGLYLHSHRLTLVLTQFCVFQGKWEYLRKYQVWSYKEQCHIVNIKINNKHHWLIF